MRPARSMTVTPGVRLVDARDWINVLLHASAELLFIMIYLTQNKVCFISPIGHAILARSSIAAAISRL